MSASPPPSLDSRPPTPLEAGQAYLFMTLATLSGGANVVAARLSVDQVSPMVLTSGRWLLVLAILAVVARRSVAAHAEELRSRWLYFVMLGACGFTVFNALFYTAAPMTTGVNMALLQGSVPVWVMLGAVLFQGASVRRGQIAGLLITLSGVLLVATGGQLGRIASLRLNIGDLMILFACMVYAVFPLSLRRGSGGGGLWFMAGVACGAFATSLPLAVAEVAFGKALWPTPLGWGILVFTAVGPSLLAQLLLITAVRLIGAARTSPFVNLVPVFGALLSVLVLGEPLHPHHVVALSLVLFGVLLAEGSARRAAKA